jgi:hypothetical protein
MRRWLMPRTNSCAVFYLVIEENKFMAPERKNMDRSVTLDLSIDNPKVKSGFEKIGKSFARWKEDLEKGRRRARAYVDEQRRKRGYGRV